MKQFNKFLALALVAGVFSINLVGAAQPWVLPEGLKNKVEFPAAVSGSGKPSFASKKRAFYRMLTVKFSEESVGIEALDAEVAQNKNSHEAKAMLAAFRVYTSFENAEKSLNTAFATMTHPDKAKYPRSAFITSGNFFGNAIVAASALVTLLREQSRTMAPATVIEYKKLVDLPDRYADEVVKFIIVLERYREASQQEKLKRDQEEAAKAAKHQDGDIFDFNPSAPLSSEANAEKKQAASVVTRKRGRSPGADLGNDKAKKSRHQRLPYNEAVGKLLSLGAVLVGSYHGGSIGKEVYWNQLCNQAAPAVEIALQLVGAVVGGGIAAAAAVGLTKPFIKAKRKNISKKVDEDKTAQAAPESKKS